MASGERMCYSLYGSWSARFFVPPEQDLRLKGVGGRVALMLRLLVGGKGKGALDPPREVVVANTHLLFPHARSVESSLSVGLVQASFRLW